MFELLYNFFGGMCLLIFGVDMMSKNLESISGNFMKKAVSTLTNNLYLSFLVGTIVTALVQSSTAVTLITVSFVNAGIMKLVQAVGIIYGANIGTTVTAQLMSINAAEFALLIFAFGFLFSIIFKKKSLKSVGKSIMGLGLMFLGIKTLQAGIPFIKSNNEVLEMFQMYGSNPFIGVLVGAVTTMMVQSSSATVGLTIVLFNENLISFASAIGLTMGDNIGTCATAQIASMGANVHARRTAWAHTLYNIFGVLLAMVFLIPFRNFIEYITFELMHQDSSKLIANTHTIFNIASAIIFLPITKYYVRLLEWIIKDIKPRIRG